jgi:hypothetical protein
MNRRRFSWRSFPILAGIFAVFLIVRLPASFATLVLPPEIQLRGVEGSFWDGRTSAVGVGDVLVQEQVSWRFLPQALLEGKLSWAVSGRLADQASRLELAVRPSGAELNGVSLALPLEPLAALHPQLKAAQLGATLRVTAKRLGINSPVVASVAVERLFTPLSPQRALGNYRVDLKGDAAGKGDWRIATLGGGLRVAGQGAFDAAQPRINGKLTLTPQSPIPGLSPLLASLPKAGEGFVMTF